MARVEFRNVPTELTTRYGYIPSPADIPVFFIKQQQKRDGRYFRNITIMLKPANNSITIYMYFIAPLIGDLNNNRATLRYLILKYLDKVNLFGTATGTNASGADGTIGHYCRTTLIPAYNTRRGNINTTHDYFDEKFRAVPLNIHDPPRAMYRLAIRGPASSLCIQNYECTIKIGEMNIFTNESLFANLKSLFTVLQAFVMKTVEMVPHNAIYGLNSPNIPSDIGSRNIVSPVFVDYFMNSNRSLPLTKTLAKTRRNPAIVGMYGINASAGAGAGSVGGRRRHSVRRRR